MPDLINKQDTRIAFINDRVFGTPAVSATAVATTGGTPVSAPNATAQALQRVAPTSERTAEAKERAARANAAKADGT